MKRCITILLLLISINTFSQIQKEHVFDSYHYKLRSNYMTLKTNQDLRIKNTGNSTFMIKSNMTPYQELISVMVKFESDFDFAGERVYQYKGLGKVLDLEVNVVIECKLDLNEFAKGTGYKSNSNDRMKNFEIHVYYWAYETREPLLKESIYIYPIKNYSVNQKIEIKQREQLIDSLKNSFADIDNYIKDYTNRIYPSLEKLAVKTFEVENIKFNDSQQKEINEIFHLRLYADKDKDNARVKITNDNSKSDFYPQQLRENLWLKLPSIKDTIDNDEYELNREANFVLKYNVVVGEVVVKNKGSEINFKSENKLTKEQKAVISQYFINKKRGIYYVKYRIGKINDKDATIIKSEKEQRAFHIGY